ncbi:MAG: HigA family addiction module antidote protein [Comamonadaceae bacterium]|uniref:HigA family addiction module antitoxin n=1 Tax=Candidatus Skiveiella danica TaxID=3386177 RepID=UPI001B4ACE93|nr:HigA family addiction module antidote protein [Comamonadaceae bacterium]MBK9197709.1 HigA family addiction module antidote protein [Betaproteobacteria bacterium]MBP8101503.1 HigA family addiction module antidote protein [Burkholderiaceae bacterium]MBK6555735.1 HigA family addiction module antidote protein [Comamonadaceae bacterium]MBK7990216.1 HigA family addiction module antidote protein [Comamonadaceae bacterium]
MARAIEVPQSRIHEIVKGLRRISAETAVRISAFFRTDAQSLINLHIDYDIIQAKETMADLLARIHRFDRVEARA